MAITIRDVAQKAGVSIRTVSRVLNNQGEITEATRQRILTIIEELGYRPNRVARSLVTQRTHTIGLVVGDITNPFFPELARGVQDTAQAKGYNLFLCNTDGNLQQEYSALETLADHAVDGIIVYPSYNSKHNIITFAKQYQPLVVVNLFVEHPGVSQIMVNHRHGARLAVDHLASRGHTAIGMLTGVQDPSPDRVRRIQGFREGLEAHHLPMVEAWIVPCLTPAFQHGYEAAKKLLSNHPQVTALFAYNDLLALGAIRACYELGRRIPGDCAIIGFDDIQWAATYTPALTTIRVDKYAVGQQAMNRLLEMLAEPGKTFPPIQLDTELIIRESA
jgi:LacI family transcriptional regulator